MTATVYLIMGVEFGVRQNPIGEGLVFSVPKLAICSEEHPSHDNLRGSLLGVVWKANGATYVDAVRNLSRDIRLYWPAIVPLVHGIDPEGEAP